MEERMGERFNLELSFRYSNDLYNLGQPGAPSSRCTSVEDLGCPGQERVQRFSREAHSGNTSLESGALHEPGEVSSR